jgi:hypothetical protein
MLLRPSCSSSSSYGSGIQRDVSFITLDAAGCTVCHEARPTSGLTSALIRSCTGPHIFVGAGLSDTSPSILLGAYASIGVITNNRTPHLSNSLYWYYRKGHYLGFFDTPDVLETNYPEGTDNYETLDIQHGLLWNIDGFGLRSRSSGLRSNPSSNVTHHARNSDLRIWIYNCPGKSTNCFSLNLNNCEELAVNIACDYCIVEHFGGLM